MYAFTRTHARNYFLSKNLLNLLQGWLNHLIDNNMRRSRFIIQIYCNQLILGKNRG